MLLLIDIGNTSTTMGFWSSGAVKETLRLKTASVKKDIDQKTGFLGSIVLDRKIGKPGGAAISSVVPGVTSILSNAVKKDFGLEPLHVDYRTKTGLTYAINNIESLGADRIANAVAARKLYKGNLVVVDIGTATTFCVITEEGEYKGGAIMPGPGLAVDSLSVKTANLPGIELKPPSSTIGKDTAENILTGVIIGHAGAVEKIVDEMRKELDTDLNLIATGGYSDLITPYIKGIAHINPLLTLEGLRFICEMNQG
ncbi:MAG: type III pantothenate kinase [Nitrospirota bacterium]